MEPSEPGEENTAGRDPYDTDIIYKQHIYLSPGKQDCRQDGYGICQQCKPKRAVRGPGACAEGHGRLCVCKELGQP